MAASSALVEDGHRDKLALADLLVSLKVDNHVGKLSLTLNFIVGPIFLPLSFL
uniref:Uncharacterized protein n=1 Tax=Rhizophagus irregularis (strain DAOM 181602 / DAOM 197198 / MUCL 43194) TaxID=747089 RepID=U9TRZ9_RHIID